MAAQEWEHKIVPVVGWKEVKVLGGGSLDAVEAGGWELVSAVPRMHGADECVWLIFKRPQPYASAIEFASAWKAVDPEEHLKGLRATCPTPVAAKNTTTATSGAGRRRSLASSASRRRRRAEGEIE
ncbi:MAG: hypothetical protein ABSH07_11580 [Candidatus Dormibacteria bacterium]|jgi:hypothetical protein